MLWVLRFHASVPSGAEITSFILEVAGLTLLGAYCVAMAARHRPSALSTYVYGTLSALLIAFEGFAVLARVSGGYEVQWTFLIALAAASCYAGYQTARWRLRRLTIVAR